MTCLLCLQVKGDGWVRQTLLKWLTCLTCRSDQVTHIKERQNEGRDLLINTKYLLQLSSLPKDSLPNAVTWKTQWHRKEVLMTPWLSWPAAFHWRSPQRHPDTWVLKPGGRETRSRLPTRAEFAASVASLQLLLIPHPLWVRKGSKERRKDFLQVKAHAATWIFLTF